MNRIIYLLCLCAVAIAEVAVTRIKEESTAAPGEFPYQVSIQIDNQHVCGGALVTRKHVVTSGTCLFNILRKPQISNNLKVVVGTINLRKDGIIHDVEKIVIHYGYQWYRRNSSFKNNIGMIHLITNVQLSKYVRQLNLRGITELPQNAELLFTGWGNTNNTNSNNNGSSVELLKKGKLRYINTQECQRYFPNLKVRQYLICTAPNKYVGNCTTDQGAPLVYGNQLVGISTGLHGCAGGNPDVFVKVSYYLKFIVDQIIDQHF